MTLIFSYGKKVEPNHDKLNAFTAIAEKYGVKVRNVEYDFEATADERVPVLLAAAREEAAKGEELIYAGTSMGCYGSWVAAREVPAKGLFLISPALFMDGYAVQDYPLEVAGEVELVIGHEDDVIPRWKVTRFVMDKQLEAHFVKDNHPMPNSLETLKVLFETYIQRVAKG